MILKKDVTSIVEGCVGVNAAYAWVNWTCVVTYVTILIRFSMFGRCTCLGPELIYAFSFKV